MAILAPFLFELNQIFKSKMSFFIFLIPTLMLSEFLIFQLNHPINILESFLYYVVPYGAIYLLGIRFSYISFNSSVLFSIVLILFWCLMSFMLFLSKGEFVYTQAFKYPPSFYYLSYATSIVFLLWAFAEKITTIIPWRIFNWIQFVSENSMWVYLWHIFMISFASLYLEPYWVRFFFTVISSVLMVFIQIYIITKWVIPKFNKSSFKKSVKLIFIG